MFRMARIAGEAGRAHRRRAGLAAWLLLLLGVIVIMASTAAAAAADAGEAGSKEWCQEAGFNSDVLKCSTCGKMGSALPDGEELVSECRQCCTEDGDGEGAVQYVLARLEFDPMFVQFVPALRAFLDGPAKALVDDGLLAIERRQGVRPNLQLFAEGQKTPGEVVSVGQWDMDTMVDFIKENVVVVAPALGGEGTAQA